MTTVSCDDLTKALTLCSGVLLSRPTRPETGSFFIQESPNSLTVTTSDDAGWIQVTLPVTTLSLEEGGAQIFAPKTIQPLVSKLAGEIELKFREEALHLNAASTRSEYSLTGFMGDEDRPLTLPVMGELFPLEAGILAPIKQLIEVAPKNNPTASIEGIHLDGNKMISTDSHRMVIRAGKTYGGSGETIRIDHIQHLPRIAEAWPVIENGLKVSISTCKQYVGFYCSYTNGISATLICSTIRDTFPGYKQILPVRRGRAKVTCDRRELIDRLSLAEVVNSTYVDLELEDDCLRITNHDAVGNAVNSKLPAKGSMPCAMQVKPAYLRSAAERAHGDSIKITFKSDGVPRDPVLIEEDKNNLELVMPQARS